MPRLHLDPGREQLVMPQHVLGVLTVEAEGDPLPGLEPATVLDQRLVVRLGRGEVEHGPQGLLAGHPGHRCDIVAICHVCDFSRGFEGQLA